jgi:hypothetical protein
MVVAATCASPTSVPPAVPASGMSAPLAARFSSDEGSEVGMDNETPVTEEYAQGQNRFTARITTVTVEITPPPRP